MTESEWLSCTDPSEMLDEVNGHLKTYSTGHQELVSKASDRKLRLIACHAARLLENNNNPDRARVINACEQIADGEESEFGTGDEGLIKARESINSIWGWVWCATSNNIKYGLRDTLQLIQGNTGSFYRQEEVANLIREVIGNPFQPVSLPWVRICGCVGMCKEACLTPMGCTWLTPQALALAQAAYSEKLDNRTLDPVRLAILADALEEAGCTEEVILQHLRTQVVCNTCERNVTHLIDLDRKQYGGCLWCRSFDTRLAGPHVKGCWVLDLLLEKE